MLRFYQNVRVLSSLTSASVRYLSKNVHIQKHYFTTSLSRPRVLPIRYLTDAIIEGLQIFSSTPLHITPKDLLVHFSMNSKGNNNHYQSFAPSRLASQLGMKPEEISEKLSEYLTSRAKGMSTYDNLFLFLTLFLRVGYQRSYYFK
jgi:hypothetical protein